MTKSAQRILPLTLFLISTIALAEGGDNERLSVGVGGVDPDGASTAPVIAAEGRYIAFTSLATNLVDADANALSDVFRLDNETGTLERISVSSAETESDGVSLNPDISADGRYVVFVSAATNLVDGDNNGVDDCFLRDVESGTTVRVNLDENGNSADAACANPAVSDDGRYVVFESAATDLVANDLLGYTNIFLRDLESASTTLISRPLSGGVANGNSVKPALSGNGRYIVFESAADDLSTDDGDTVLDVYWLDREQNDLRLVSRDSTTSSVVKGNGDSTRADVDDEGRYVVFQSLADNLVSSDGNSVSDCFLRNIVAGATTRLNVDSSGSESAGACSFVRIDADGDYVTFVSLGSDLVSGDGNGVADVFAKARDGSEILLLSRGTGDVDSDAASDEPTIGDEGNFVVWSSAATNLVSSDGNSLSDVFITENDICPGVAKVSPGQCGCDVEDTDTDSDGTADCLDLCSSDPLKIAPGACGCGVSDDDTNGTGAADCLDPTAATVPTQPHILFKERCGTAEAIMQAFPSGSYQLRYKPAGGSVYRTRTTNRSNAIVLRGLAKGRYVARYRVTVAGITTQYSRFRKFRVRCGR